MKKSFEDQRVAVLGLGETGLSALRWLKAQGAEVMMVDSRVNPPGLAELQKNYPDVEVTVGHFDAPLLASVDLIVISPGVSLQESAVQQAMANGVNVIGDVELFAQYRSPYSKLIAITGSNGKTTVTTLVGEICKQAGLKTIVAGNIGLPVLDTLQMDAPDVYVLELSSFQLETTSSLKADVATVLNISEDHMDRYNGLEDYAKAKARIYMQAKLALVNRDDPLSITLAEHQLAQVDSVSFGLDEAPTVKDYGIQAPDWLTSGSRKWLQADELKIRGKHNMANALAAMALSRAIGVDKVSIINTLKHFKGLPHRVEFVTSIEEVDYYDDSKGTNVGATCAAIQGMLKHGQPQKVVLIAGGDGKGQDFSPLREAVRQHARAVVLIGRDAPLIQAVLDSSVQARGLPVVDAVDLEAAVNIAHTLAEKGDAVLLSPACASFDMFKNYEHRAQVFVQAVRDLEAKRC